MNQINKSLIDQWLKGIGIFLLVFIDLNYLLTTKFKILEANKKYEAFVYLVLIISIIYLPLLFGKILNYICLILSKIINNWQAENNTVKLEYLLSWCFAITINTIAIKKLFTQGTSKSIKIYMQPKMFDNTDKVLNYFFNANFGTIILLSLISTVILFFLCNLFSVSKFPQKIFIEYIIVIVFLVTVSIIAWNLIYLDNNFLRSGFSNYHLNAVLFPIAAVNGNSPFIPLVSDQFTTWYGGYYLWLGLLFRLMGNSLLSMKITLVALIVIQIIIYYLIIKAMYKNLFIRILVFISGLFWSYFYGKAVTQDLYFQYFPLRTLFPSILIFTFLFTSKIRFLDKVVFSIGSITITWRDVLGDFIVAIAILNNLDSGISVLIMYVFINNWTYLKSDKFLQVKQLINALIKLSINFIIIIAILVFSLRILAGTFIDFSLFIEITKKAQTGYLGIPLPDNIWIIFMVFYGFNIVQCWRSSIEDTQAKYRFGIAIWGMISIYYFINRSHPWNLLNVSIPFFLSYGFFIEQAFYTQEINQSQTELLQNQIGLTKYIKVLLPNWSNLLIISLLSVLIMPFIIFSLIACVKFIPLSIRALKMPINNSQMEAVETLSQKVATLESQLKRPSIFLSGSFDSFYYLHKNRPVLFYPDAGSILAWDDSFKARFTDSLNKFNPIVILCPLELAYNEKNIDKFFQKIYNTFVESLKENNYKMISSEKKIDAKTNGSCNIYIRN